MTAHQCIWCGQDLPNRVIAGIAGVSASSVDRYMRRQAIDPGIRRRIDLTIARLTQDIPRRAGASAIADPRTGSSDVETRRSLSR
jgi:hypothetical protein